MFNETTLWDTCNYIGTKVSRFLEGPEVPLGIFPHLRDSLKLNIKSIFNIVLVLQGISFYYQKLC